MDTREPAPRAKIAVPLTMEAEVVTSTRLPAFSVLMALPGSAVKPLISAP